MFLSKIIVTILSLCLIFNNVFGGNTSENMSDDGFESEKNFQPKIDNVGNIMKNRSFVKLTMKQGLLMNQVLTAYALSNVQNALCKKHVEEFKQGLRAFEPWALQMFDSSSKIQSGILAGNLVEYGSFDQCLKIYKNLGDDVIRGKLCSLRIKPNEYLVKKILSYRNVSEKRFDRVKTSVLEGVKMIWSVCVPDSCYSKDIYPHFNKSINELLEGLEIYISLDDENCSTLENQFSLTVKEYCFIFFLIIFILLVLTCTIVEWKIKTTNEFILGFSIISNGERLFSNKNRKDEISCLHGIRALSVCYIMFGHRFMTSMLFPSVNSLDLLDWILEYRSTAIIGGTVSVDTFFLVSGTLVSYVFFKTVENTNRMNFLLFYLHRYIRITLPLAIAVIVYSSFIQFFGSGPLWYENYISMQKPCQKYWWSALLHLQSYINPHEICIPQTWYLTCDTLFYYFSTLILYPLWKWPYLGKANLIFIYIMSILSNFYFAWINRYEGGMPLTNQLFRTKYFQRYYIAPHTRASPYIIGLGLGYALYGTKGRKIEMNQIFNFACWFISMGCMLFVVLRSHAYQEESHDYNRTEATLYLSFSRSLWTLGIAWIIWSCIHGFGGIVNDFLSLYIFRFFGRIGFGVYLFHMCLQFLKDAAGRMPRYFSNFHSLYDCGADLVIMTLIGIGFTLFFEYPFQTIELIFRRKHKKVHTTLDKE